MSYKLFLLLLQLMTSAYALSLGRYNHRVVGRYDTVERHRRTHQEEHKNSVDCMFNICQHVPDYPEDKVKNIIDSHSALHTYFGGSVIEPANSTISINSRTNGEPPESFCKILDVTTVPKLMTDIDNVQRDIANVKNYSQVVKFQTCDFSNGEECFPENLLDYKTKCVQKYNVIKLVTVNLKAEALEYRKFRIPSTCVCTYTRA